MALVTYFPNHRGVYNEMSSNGTTLDITGLDGLTDRVYELRVWAKNSSAGADADLFLQPNAQAANLRSNGSAAAIYAGTIRAGTTNPAIWQGTIVVRSGEIRTFSGTYQHQMAGGLNVVGHTAGEWTDTAANLTSLRLTAATLAAGTWMAAWPIDGRRAL